MLIASELFTYELDKISNMTHFLVALRPNKGSLKPVVV